MSTSDAGYLLLGQETLDSVLQWDWGSWLREAEGPDSWLQSQVRRGLWDVERFSQGCWFRWDPGLSLAASTFIMWMNGPA